MPTLERPLQPLHRRVVAFQHQPADLTASAMIATLIQRHPALGRPRKVCTAVAVFAVRGGRPLSVALSRKMETLGLEDQKVEMLERQKNIDEKMKVARARAV